MKKAIIETAAFVAFALILGGYIYNSIQQAGGDDPSKQPKPQPYSPAVTREDIPQDWETYQHGTYYEVRYPATWGYYPAPQASHFAPLNHNGEAVISIEDAFPTAIGMWQVTEARKKAVLASGYSQGRTVSYSITLQDATPANLEIFDLMLASLRFLQ